MLNVLSLPGFPDKLCWSRWAIPGDSGCTLPTSGMNKDGESVKEQDLPYLHHGRRRHNAIEHHAVLETGSKGNAHLLSRQGTQDGSFIC